MVMVSKSVGTHGGHNPSLPPSDAMSGEEHVDIRRMDLWFRRKMPRHEPHYLWGDDHFMGDTGLFRHHIDGLGTQGIQFFSFVPAVRIGESPSSRILGA